jgi:hypothetical protein
MTEFDRITTDSWTVAFPSSWPDASETDGTLYFESPAGDKGFYISLWLLSDEETRGSRELIESFQSTELRSFFPADEIWDVISQVAEEDDSYATGYWKGSTVSGSIRSAASRAPQASTCYGLPFMTMARQGRSHRQTSFPPLLGHLRLAQPNNPFDPMPLRGTP